MDVIHPLIKPKRHGDHRRRVEEMLAAIREAHGAGKFVYAMKSLAGGNFVPDREASLRFIFDTPEIDAVVVGMVTPWKLSGICGSRRAGPFPKTCPGHGAVHQAPEYRGPGLRGCGECVEHCENEALSVVDGKATVDHERCILCGYCAPIASAGNPHGLSGFRFQGPGPRRWVSKPGPGA